MIKILSIFVLISFLGCASEKPKGKTEAEVLYKEAKVLMDDESYLLATEKLNILKNKFPYSYYATPAELMQADILFLQENFVEAAAAYLLFRDFHPKNEKIPYVVYKIADSYYNQLPDTHDRDLEPAIEAIKYYQELIQNYPSSKYISEANERIGKARAMLRKKEQYVADFYFKTEVYSAARWRYRDILSRFDDKKLRSHSMQRIVLSTYFLKEYKNCINLSNQYFKLLEGKDKKVVNEYKNYCKNKI